MQPTKSFEEQGAQAMDRGARRAIVAMAGAEVGRAIADALAFRDVQCILADTGASALALTQELRPVLVVLDLDQPDVDGLVLCADLHARTGAAIIVCGDASKRREALLAFRLGATDFVAKPFDIDDLVARAEVALRRVAVTLERPAARDPVSLPPSTPARREESRLRSMWAPGAERATARGAPSESRVERVGHLTLDHTHHRVLVGGREVRLSRSEYLLLGALMSRADELLSRLELAGAVWGDQLASVGRPIDQHMYRLRAKLQRAANEARVPVPVIVSVPGFGYRLIAPKAKELRAAG